MKFIYFLFTAILVSFSTQTSASPSAREFCESILTRVQNLVSQKATGYLIAHNNPNIFGQTAYLEESYQHPVSSEFVGQSGTIRLWKAFEIASLYDDEPRHSFKAKFVRLWRGKIVSQNSRGVVLETSSGKQLTLSLPKEHVQENDLYQGLLVAARNNRDWDGDVTGLTQYRGYYLTFLPFSNP